MSETATATHATGAVEELKKRPYVVVFVVLAVVTLVELSVYSLGLPHLETIIIPVSQLARAEGSVMPLISSARRITARIASAPAPPAISSGRRCRPAYRSDSNGRLATGRIGRSPTLVNPARLGMVMLDAPPPGIGGAPAPIAGIIRATMPGR